MANTIKIKRTNTPSAAPASLEYGELAINYADGKLFYKNSSNQITQFSSGQKTTTSTTAPVSPALGDLWFESDTGKTFIYYDSFWVEVCGALVAASSDGASTLTTKGDLLSRSSGGLARLAVGTNGYFLKANSATATGLEWGAIPTVSILDDVGDVTITSATSGDILKWNGSNWVNDSALLAAKAPLASPTFTGTVSGITATMVGLGSVDNTSDTAKPVSTAQQTALDLKANLASPTLTGTPSAPTAAVSTNTTQIATTAFVRAEVSALVGGATATLDTLGEIATALGNDANLSTTLTSSIALKAPLASPTFTGTVTIPAGASISGFALLASPTFTGTVSGITATMVGLGSVDNTADTAKPVSTAQQTALNLKADLASPTLTGTPIAPTAAGGTNTTQIATTAFVTTAVSGATITSLDDVADVTITSNSNGHFLKWNGTAWVNDAIDLGTDTTGSYVTSLVAGTGVTLTGNSGEGATPTVTVDTTVIQARVANVTDTEIGYLDGVTSAIQTQIDTKLASSTAGTTYAPIASPTFTGTPTLPTGTIATTQTAANSTTAIATTAFVTTADNLKANLASPTFTGTATFNDATVSGNLIVSGTTTSINTETLTVDDNIIVLNNNATGAPSQDAGIEIERGTSTNVQIRWNETTDKWQFTNDGSTYNDLGAGGATISDTPPASPVTGQLWYESDTGLAYVYYDSFWVEIGGGSAYDTVINTIQAKGDLLAGTASQTLDRVTVGTNNQRLIANSSTSTGLSWANDTTNTVIDTKGDLLVGATADVVAKLTVGTDNQMLVANSSATNGLAWVDQPLGFRNKIINGDFGINQRAFTSTTTSGTFGFDRWQVGLSGGTVTYSAQTFSTGNAITGYEPTNYARVVTSGHSASTDSALLIHKIEDVRNCAGQTVTISFWAQAASGTPKVAVQITQSFGTGGSPSADVDTYIGQATLSTSWTRYTLTFVVPSISGKTIGTTANTSFLRLNLWTSAGSNNNASTGSLGVQNTTINLWGVQLEQNAMATPFEQLLYTLKMSLCQRYYTVFEARRLNSEGYASSAGYGYYSNVGFPSEMRVAPTITLPAATQSGNTTGIATNASVDGVVYFFGSAAAGNAYVLWNAGLKATASAEF